MNKSMTPVLVVLSMLPTAFITLAIFLLLPDEIPLHVGFSGIDDYGSKYGAFILASVLTACNLLSTVLFYNAEKLYARGFVHGTDARGARLMCFITILILDIVCIGVILFYRFG